MSSSAYPSTSKVTQRMGFKTSGSSKPSKSPVTPTVANTRTSPKDLPPIPAFQPREPSLSVNEVPNLAQSSNPRGAKWKGKAKQFFTTSSTTTLKITGVSRRLKDKVVLLKGIFNNSPVDQPSEGQTDYSSPPTFSAPETSPFQRNLGPRRIIAVSELSPSLFSRSSASSDASTIVSESDHLATPRGLSTLDEEEEFEELDLDDDDELLVDAIILQVDRSRVSPPWMSKTLPDATDFMRGHQTRPSIETPLSLLSFADQMSERQSWRDSRLGDAIFSDRGSRYADSDAGRRAPSLFLLPLENQADDHGSVAVWSEDGEESSVGDSEYEDANDEMESYLLVDENGRTPPNTDPVVILIPSSGTLTPKRSRSRASGSVTTRSLRSLSFYSASLAPSSPRSTPRSLAVPLPNRSSFRPPSQLRPSPLSIYSVNASTDSYSSSDTIDKASTIPTPAIGLPNVSQNVKQPTTPPKLSTPKTSVSQSPYRSRPLSPTQPQNSSVTVTYALSRNIPSSSVKSPSGMSTSRLPGSTLPTSLESSRSPQLRRKAQIQCLREGARSPVGSPLQDSPSFNPSRPAREQMRIQQPLPQEPPSPLASRIANSREVTMISPTPNSPSRRRSHKPKVPSYSPSPSPIPFHQPPLQPRTKPSNNTMFTSSTTTLASTSASASKSSLNLLLKEQHTGDTSSSARSTPTPLGKPTRTSSYPSVVKSSDARSSRSRTSSLHSTNSSPQQISQMTEEFLESSGKAFQGQAFRAIEVLDGYGQREVYVGHGK